VIAALALAAGLSTAFAQTVVWSDNFDDNNPIGWFKGASGQIDEVNQQFVVSASFGPAQTNSPTATHAAGAHAIPTAGALPDQQTLELRAELVGANQNDAFAGLHFYWSAQGRGFAFFKDEDEVGLAKFWNVGASLAWFFYEQRPLKNQNVTLVLALTRRGSNVEIRTRVLDKGNGNAVLFDRTVLDTPQADSTLPNRSVRGMISGPDPVGTPWPVSQAPTEVELTLTWVNSDHGPDPAAEVTFDDLEVWQYESPQLTIQKAVVLSWPLTQGQFVLESAAALDGPWTPVPDPWWRTNAGRNEVSIPAPETLKLFRLAQ